MARRRRGEPLNGWLIIDKAPGLSSAQVVSRVRWLTNAAKAGHAGTLDPLASGVLPVALGEATKTVPFAMDASKTYVFTVRWGEARSTDDAEGDVLQTSAARPDPAAIAAVLPEFIGEIWQTPPVYSAIKLAGERAYDLARRGEPVSPEARQVRIYQFELVRQIDADHAEFRVDCGKGAYVRSLARDLGARLGCLGHVSQLRRTRVGGFRAEAAISLDKLQELWQNSPPSTHLLPVETALADIPALALTGPQADRLRRGQPIRVLDTRDGTVCAMAMGKPVALAEIAGGEVRPVRVFNL